jgi:hypothetical protein
MAARHSQQGRRYCFHNGTDVLPEVRAWHNHLRSSISHADRITGPLLDLIDERLLQADRDVRPSASVLYDQLMRILQRVEQDEANFLPEPFVLGDQTQYELYGASATDLIPSSIATDLVETTSKFRDSAIGMGISEAAMISSQKE